MKTIQRTSFNLGILTGMGITVAVIALSLLVASMIYV